MSGAILHLDPCGVGRPLAVAPGEYIVTGPDRYVHMPRSLSVGPYGAHATYWCGPSARMSKGRARWANEVPEGMQVCGTCSGRRAGYHREAGLVFAPTKTLDDLTRRRWCPGPRMGLYHAPNLTGLRWRDAECLLCGHQGQLGCGGGAYHSSIHLRQHEPASTKALIYCPCHGFRELRTGGNGSVWCGSFGCVEIVSHRGSS